MNYRKVDAIKEELSIIGFGCWSVASYNWTDGNIEDAKKAIDVSIDSGVNFFDVAPVYGYGDSEKILGDVISADGKREKIFLATKCGLRWDVKDGPTKNDLSKASILFEIDESLKRLKTDHVDLYQLHWPDHKTPLEETIDALKEIIKAGKIRYVGLSNYSLADMKNFNESLPVASYQGLYNLFDRNSEFYCGIPLEYQTEAEILPYCVQNGIAFIPYSPLNQGLLSGRYYQQRDTNLNAADMRLTNPELVGENLNKKLIVVEKLKELAQDTGYTLTQLSLGWLMANQAVTSIIVGSRKPSYALENAQMGNIKLESAVVDSINKVFLDNYD